MEFNHSFNLLDEDKTPLTVHEDIIKYLREQDMIGGEDEEFYQSLTNFTEAQVKDILEELLERFEIIQKSKEDYEARVTAHNQYPLFDLKTILPDFDIDENMYENLTFRENLVIHSSDPDTAAEPRPVGGLCLDIQKATGCPPVQRKPLNIEERIKKILEEEDQIQRKAHGREEDDNCNGKQETVTQEESLDLEDDLEIQRKRACSKFLVHVSSEFDVQGFSAGSRITTWVDRNMHTLEELRKEFLMEETENEKNPLEKTLYSGLLKKCYYVKHCSTRESLEDRKFYSLRKTRDLISEGSNFLLMRYLAITKYIGTFELSCMYINGDMCRNIYECTGPEGDIVNDTKLDTCKIYRNIIEECGIEHKCITELSLQGQILKQTWEGINYSLYVNPLAAVKNEKPVGNEQILFKHAWEKDMQLLSKYLDEKMRNTMKMKSYMMDHPEFKNIISDYVQSILLMKPEDIIEFTINHFLSFAPQYIQQNDYFF